ncbi:hypothetical protein D0T53_05925 [Dysgonomonas sp. 216]|uniref:hypothetical protein n=1 Tax=Dysgonomonas sp. 216 TaxID=2302934 RepID=UPI0013D0B0C6|nr:hypothetical protein [Dysgonomonas sp. 216]NDW18452.1 hypothetical protein [Dysgonomonas sp. 216]
MKHTGLIILIFFFLFELPLFGSGDKLPSDGVYKEIEDSYKFAQTELPTQTSDEPDGPPIAGEVPLNNIGLQCIAILGLIYFVVKRRKRDIV